ncbi:MAG TPA: hypothetical protein VL977_01365, partial [Solirubrobacteraceae bacterium]|nr:hypothetical protein [Solirubrobacteraceae bacterium]
MSTISAVAEEQRPAVARVRSGRLALALAALCSAVLVAAAGEIVLDAAVGHTPMVPRQPPFDSWLAGFGQSLGYDVFLPALLASCAAYAVLIVIAQRSRTISLRWAVALIALLQAMLFASPVLLATDLFTNVSYAREL